MEEIEIEEGEVITSFDVNALFTSLPSKEVVQMAILRAKEDPTWNERTLMTPVELGDLLKMVVETTYLRFQGKICEQTFSMSMCSPLSPSLSNLFMEFFKEKALEEAPHPHKYWGTYLDDTGVVTKKIYEEELFDYIKNQHPSIKFMFEREDIDNSLPMLDFKLTKNHNRIETDNYHKPTHTDQYLQWTSHHLVQ